MEIKIVLKTTGGVCVYAAMVPYERVAEVGVVIHNGRYYTYEPATRVTGQATFVEVAAFTTEGE